jgi:hypothetical protein
VATVVWALNCEAAPFFGLFKHPPSERVLVRGVNIHWQVGQRNHRALKAQASHEALLLWGLAVCRLSCQVLGVASVKDGADNVFF